MTLLPVFYRGRQIGTGAMVWEFGENRLDVEVDEGELPNLPPGGVAMTVIVSRVTAAPVRFELRDAEEAVN